MLACDQDRSSGSEASWTELRLNRPGIGNGDGAVFVQLALPAVVKQTEGRIAILLDLGKHDAGAYGVDRTGGDEDDVVCCDRPPFGQAGNRTVPDRRTQFLWREMLFQSNGNPRVWLCREDVPCLGLAVRQADRARECVVGMNLDRQWLTGEQ